MGVEEGEGKAEGRERRKETVDGVENGFGLWRVEESEFFGTEGEDRKKATCEVGGKNDEKMIEDVRRGGDRLFGVRLRLTTFFASEEKREGVFVVCVGFLVVTREGEGRIHRGGRIEVGEDR